MLPQASLDGFHGKVNAMLTSSQTLKGRASTIHHLPQLQHRAQKESVNFTCNFPRLPSTFKILEHTLRGSPLEVVIRICHRAQTGHLLHVIDNFDLDLREAVTLIPHDYYLPLVAEIQTALVSVLGDLDHIQLMPTSHTNCDVLANARLVNLTCNMMPQGK